MALSDLTAAANHAAASMTGVSLAAADLTKQIDGIPSLDPKAANDAKFASGGGISDVGGSTPDGQSLADYEAGKGTHGPAAPPAATTFHGLIASAITSAVREAVNTTLANTHNQMSQTADRMSQMVDHVTRTLGDPQLIQALNQIAQTNVGGYLDELVQNLRAIESGRLNLHDANVLRNTDMFIEQYIMRIMAGRAGGNIDWAHFEVLMTQLIRQQNAARATQTNRGGGGSSSSGNTNSNDITSLESLLSAGELFS